MLEVRCPRCRAVLSAEKTPIGSRVGCKKCGHVFSLEVAFTEPAPVQSSSGPAASGADSADVLIIRDTGSDADPRARRRVIPLPQANNTIPQRSCCAAGRSLVMIGCLVGAVLAVGLWSKSMRRHCGFAPRPSQCPSSSVRHLEPTVECLISCDEPGPAVRIADRSDGHALKLEGHLQPVRSVAVSPDGALVATGSSDNLVRLWSRASGKNVAMLCHRDSVESVAFSPDGKTLASASGGSIWLWDIHNPGKVPGAKELPLHAGGLAAVAFSPDGRKIAAAGSNATIRLVSADPAAHPDGDIAGAQAEIIEGHTGTIRTLAFSPDGKTLASAGDDKTVRLWKVETWKELARCDHADVVSSLAFSPDGKSLAASDFGGNVKVWDTSVPAEARARLQMSWPRAGRRVNCVAISADGSRLAAGDQDGTVQIWSLADGKAVRTLPAIHPEGVNSEAFSPDNANLITGGSDNLARIWDLPGLSRPSLK